MLNIALKDAANTMDTVQFSVHLNVFITIMNQSKTGNH